MEKKQSSADAAKLIREIEESIEKTNALIERSRALLVETRERLAKAQRELAIEAEGRKPKDHPAKNQAKLPH